MRRVVHEDALVSVGADELSDAFPCAVHLRGSIHSEELVRVGLDDRGQLVARSSDRERKRSV